MDLALEDMPPKLKELLADFDRVNVLRARAGFDKLSDATMGSYAVNNQRFVSRMRAGEARRVHPDIMRRAKAWLKAETARYEQQSRRRK